MTPSSNSPENPSANLSDDALKSTARGAMRRCLMLTAGLIAATGVTLLAACAPPPPAAPRPSPSPTPAPPPVAQPLPPQQTIANWADTPQTPGTWAYRDDRNASRALFGTTQSGAQFTMACEKAGRQIRLWRAGSPANPAATDMTIATTSTTRTIPAAIQSGAAPQLAASLSPGDSIVDAIVFSRGRFAVAVEGLPLLVMPSWAEVARVVQDCR